MERDIKRQRPERKKTLNKKKSNFQIRLEEAMKAKQKAKKRKNN